MKLLLFSFLLWVCLFCAHFSKDDDITFIFSALTLVFSVKCWNEFKKLIKNG